MRVGRLITVGTMALGAYRIYKERKQESGAEEGARGRGASRGLGGLFGRR